MSHLLRTSHCRAQRMKAAHQCMCLTSGGRSTIKQTAISQEAQVMYVVHVSLNRQRSSTNVAAYGDLVIPNKEHCIASHRKKKRLNCSQLDGKRVFLRAELALTLQRTTCRCDNGIPLAMSKGSHEQIFRKVLTCISDIPLKSFLGCCYFVVFVSDCKSITQTPLAPPNKV